MMKLWITKMQVVNQQTHDLHWVSGPRVKAPTWEAAQALLDKYNFHYLILDGQLVQEIPCISGTLEPDWNRMVDYDAIENN